MLASAPLAGQERGAIALGEAVQHLGVTARVLMIGAHPDDEDTNLITWLQRGRGVETAYLSLTRGDGGQNLIGNELGEALGVIRTEELLAARRIDGARQYFTRAFDFGFSKDTIDTYKHWSRDSILGDVVRVVRAFRPHVIVAVFSGTTRDGHGHHQVSGLLARAAYDVSADTARFAVASHGAPWTVPNFDLGARGNAQAGTLGMNVGEYSPLLGRSYGEIAGESRSQHKSQGFGALQRKGPIMNYVRREASRVNESATANGEKSMFDGIDTSWARFRQGMPTPALQRMIDSIPQVLAAARSAYDPFAPPKTLPALGTALQLMANLCRPAPVTPCERHERDGAAIRRAVLNADLRNSIDVALGRIINAERAASGISLEAESLEGWPQNALRPVHVTMYNNGKDTIAVSGGAVSGNIGPAISPTRFLPPGGVLRDSLIGRVDSVFAPWWMSGGRTGGMFLRPGAGVAANGGDVYPAVWYTVDLGGRRMGQAFMVYAPVVSRSVDQTKGEVIRSVVGVPLISVTVDPAVQYFRANADMERLVSVRLRSPIDTAGADARVTLVLPPGITADSVQRTVRLPDMGADVTVQFRLRGRLAPGEYTITAQAESRGSIYTAGYDLIDYDHIRRQRIYRPASIRLSAVDVKVPGTLRVAYVPGVGDNVAPALTQLGIPVTVIAAGDIARADLTPYTSVVIGPRAYEANPELLAANPKLFDFARRGGTLVVQYGQYEMTQPGATPFPITINRPHDRVTHEDTPVTIDAPAARELTAPNRIASADFDGWVQERGLYMPRTFAPEYSALLSMSDTGEPPIRGGILVAPLGQGRYIYTSLAFFRQLPAGVPGAARLFVNLLSANLAPSVTP